MSGSPNREKHICAAIAGFEGIIQMQCAVPYIATYDKIVIKLATEGFHTKR